jgi:exosome complex component RRP42
MFSLVGQNEIASVCAACASGQRVDGRKLDELQTLEVQTDPASQASGSARLRMGDTEVLVGVKVGGLPVGEYTLLGEEDPCLCR